VQQQPGKAPALLFLAGEHPHPVADVGQIGMALLQGDWLFIAAKVIFSALLRLGISAKRNSASRACWRKFGSAG
jgi:hypothetical protein